MGLQRVGRDRVPFTFALVTAHKLQKLAGESKEAQSALRTDGASDPMRVQGGQLGSTLRPGFLVCTGSERPKSQSCPALRPVDCSPPGSSVHGILQEERWSGLPCPPPGELPDPGIETRLPHWPLNSLRPSHPVKPS